MFIGLDREMEKMIWEMILDVSSIYMVCINAKILS